MLSGGPSTLPHPLVIDNLHVCQGHRGRCVRLRPRYRKRNIDASKSGASLSPSNSAHGRLGTQRPFRATAPHARWTNALRVDHPSPPEPFQPRRRPESIKARTSPITQLQDALQSCTDIHAETIPLTECDLSTKCQGHTPADRSAQSAHWRRLSVRPILASRYCIALAISVVVGRCVAAAHHGNQPRRCRPSLRIAS